MEIKGAQTGITLVKWLMAAALKDSEFARTYMPAHEAASAFPFDLEGLGRFDAIILSDIGANTFLLPPSVWLKGRPTPNRLKLARESVDSGLLLTEQLGGHPKGGNSLKSLQEITTRSDTHGSISIQEGRPLAHADNMKSRVPSRTRRKSGSGAKHLVL
jgi:Putative glutamine amidotransferase